MAQPMRSPAVGTPTVLPAKQVDVLKVIGFLQLQYGEPAEAVVLFDALHALFPADRNLALSLALARLRTGDPQSALEVLNDTPGMATADSPLGTGYVPGSLDACHHLLRAQALSALGRMTEAARCMRLFIRQRRLFESRESA